MPGLGTSFGRGGATTFQQDLQNSDCILIMGSNMAENHPVGFQWVMEARDRGAEIIHVDPRYTRTSAVATQYAPIRPGTDIAFLGGIINYILSNDRWFHEYVVHYTNAQVIVDVRFRGAEDDDGRFSGFDAESDQYDLASWQYDDIDLHGSAGRRMGSAASGGKQTTHPLSPGEKAAEERQLEHGLPPHVDPTLQNPRCVFQLLKRHYARYTPEMVERICGTPRDAFLRDCARRCATNSGRERTSAIAYAVGWTQHTVGVQYIRAASIVQLLLGNIGRPGGGILALRGHASIQGSTDIPTLYELLPGYLPMPHAEQPDLKTYLKKLTAKGGYWGHVDAYIISLLKAWYGERATADNEFGYQHLPRVTGDHSIYPDRHGHARRKRQRLLLRRRKSGGRFGERFTPPSRDGESRVARRSRFLRDRERVVLEGFARNRDRRVENRRHRHRDFLSAGRRPHAEERLVHQHAAPPAVAP